MNAFKHINATARLITEKALNLLAANPRLRDILDNQSISRITKDQGRLAGRPWDEVDLLFTQCRRQLKSSPDWRYGTPRVHEVAWEAYEGLSARTDIINKKYCELGCGVMHPFGVATIFFLNGASSVTAMDHAPCRSSTRAAEALADLLDDCRAHPEDWHWSQISRAEFEARIKLFDRKNLRDGNLQNGTLNVPIVHVIADIHSPVVAFGEIDLISSRAVLEHFLDFKTAMKQLFKLMHPGGIGYHQIDLADHRIYSAPHLYHAWSFLGEVDSWSDGLVNRLRPMEMKEIIKTTGFNILDWQIREGKIPSDFLPSITDRFLGMPMSELRATGVAAVIQRPL